MKAIETSTFEQLSKDEGMDVLWQKLRYELPVTIKGAVPQGIVLQRRSHVEASASCDGQWPAAGMDDSTKVLCGPHRAEHLHG